MDTPICRAAYDMGMAILVLVKLEKGLASWEQHLPNYCSSAICYGVYIAIDCWW